LCQITLDDFTIKELPLDAPAHVPWWPRPDWELFNITYRAKIEQAARAATGGSS
jgi:hypothetical protein